VRQEGPGQDCGPKRAFSHWHLLPMARGAGRLRSVAFFTILNRERAAAFGWAHGGRKCPGLLAGRQPNLDRLSRPHGSLVGSEHGQRAPQDRGHAGYVKAVQSRDGLTAASVRYDHVNRLWDLRNGQMITSYEVHNRPALSSCFPPMANDLLRRRRRSMSFVGAGPRLPQASEAAPTGIATCFGWSGRGD